VSLYSHAVVYLYDECLGIIYVIYGYIANNVLVDGTGAASALHAATECNDSGAACNGGGETRNGRR